MNKKTMFAAGIGFFIGVSMVGISQTEFSRRTTSGAVSEIFLSNNQEGREILNTDVTFVDEDVDLSDLPVFATTEENEVGRFELHTLGDSQSFLVLDSTTGVVRGFYESGDVVVYNQRVPNHAAARPLEIHDAFERVK